MQQKWRTGWISIGSSSIQPEYVEDVGGLGKGAQVVIYSICTGCDDF